MSPTLFSTRSLEQQTQLDAWREWFWPVFEISPQQPDHGFSAENQAWNVGGLLVSRVSAPAARVVRGKANLAKAAIDHWVLTYCRHGATTIRTKTSELTAPAGVPFIWSLGAESDCERTDVDRVQVLIPRDAFQDLTALLDAATGTVLDTPLGRLLGDYMLLVERAIPTLSEDDLPRLATAVHSMIAACVSPSRERIALAENEMMRGTLERVRQAVLQHLKSPRLDPSTLSRIVGISRSQLYRVLEHSGGVAHYIKRQRLIQAHAALSDPENRRSIQTIAEDFCFAEASSFSRAFKGEFGLSPRDIRSAAVTGNDPVQTPAKQRTPLRQRGGRFGDLLRSQ